MALALYRLVGMTTLQAIPSTTFSRKRRDFLKGALAAQILAGQTILTTALSAHADSVTGLPLAELQTRLGRDKTTLESLVLIPSDEQFAAFQVSFNKRTLKLPQARCLPVSTQAVAIAVKWAREFNVEFAVRGRGHSYEGYSQSNGLVIDLRLMSDLDFNAANGRVSVGGGAQLFDIYSYLSKYGMAIPAGSCPPVGVGGHTLGGGFGLIGRKFGLACDNVVGFEMVDATGAVLVVSATENPDLFWALRGGGAGNFGIVTRFIFQARPVGRVATFGITWDLPVEKALDVARAWQEWAPNAPDDVTSIFRFMRKGHLIRLHAAGVTLGSVEDLKMELTKLVDCAKPGSYHVDSMTFMSMVHKFGGNTAYESIYMKAKSDYMFKPMTDEGLLTLMAALLACDTNVAVIFDSYGGAINRLKNSETAFVHREGAQYAIQYYTQWAKQSESAAHMADIRGIYSAMRPHVSGQCYVNYCDLDLADGPTAYWSTNLQRLTAVKASFDPTNFFQHAQSLPVARAGRS